MPDYPDTPDWTHTDARQTPVPKTTCLFCKLNQDNWHPDTHPIQLDTDETLCSQCHHDLREYNRYRKLFIAASDGFAPAAKRIIHDHLEAAARDLASLYDDDPDMPFLDTIQSDAATHDQQP